MYDEYNEEAIINQINSLFQSQSFSGEDREVVLTIRARASQIVLEEVYRPAYEPLDPLHYKPLRMGQRYYRISLRNPTPPPGSFVFELKYPKQFSYYRLGEEPNATYYKHTEGRNRMQFFLPDTGPQREGSWHESTYLDTEDYANQGGHGRLYEVNFTDLPDPIQMLEGDCE